MSEEKLLPNASEMRKIIKNIYSLSQKLKGNISINSLDEAATLAANAYGFSSWKEYKIILNKENEKNINYHLSLTNTENHQSHSTFEISKGQKIVECITYIPENINNQQFIPKLLENKGKPKEWSIGKHYQKVGKFYEPKKLLLDNTMIIGSSIIPIEKIFIKQLELLDNDKQSYIAFVSESSSKDFLAIESYYEFQKETTFIGKKHIPLNPIKELLLHDKLNYLFNLKTDEQVAYLNIILESLDYIYGKNKSNVTIYELIKFTELENLLNIYNSANNKKELPRILEYYLFNICKIKKSDKHYIIEDYGYKNHSNHANYIKNVLLEIKMFYENGYFSLESDCILHKAFLEKENLIIVKEDNVNYQNIVVNLYATVAKCYEKMFLEMNLNSNDYKVWTLWWNAENWISEDTQNRINELEECFYMYYYISSDFRHLNNIAKNIKQILFTKNNPYGYPDSMKKNILNMTSFYEENFWYGNNKVLRDLEENEAFLWQVNYVYAIKENFEDYKLEKIQLY